MIAIFHLFWDYTFRVVALGSAMLGAISGVMGSFAVLRRQGLLGDGVSHAALPGVAIAFIVTGSKNTEILLFGALLTGLLATLCIILVINKSRIKFDSALAVILSSFFGLGMVLLTLIQKSPVANQAGLKRFIYGQASTLMKRDLWVMLICGFVLFLVVLLFWKEFKLFIFDSGFAKSLGYPMVKLNMLLSLLVVVTIIIGIQTVGVVLMSAMLISPAVAARQWSNRLWVMALLGALFGALSGVIGTAISSLIPGLPAGPAIVVCVSVITLLSLLIAPKRGILAKIIVRIKNIEALKRRCKGNESTI